MILALGAVLLTSFNGAYWLTRSGKEWFSPFTCLQLKPGILLVLFAGLIWAITPIFEKTAIQHTYPTSPRFTAFMIDLLLILFLTIPALHRGRTSLYKLRSHHRDLVLAGMIAGTAPVLGYTAFSLGPVGYVTTLFKFSSLITVLWAAIFLQEHNVQERFPAAFLMVIGAILLTI